MNLRSTLTRYIPLIAVSALLAVLFGISIVSAQTTTCDPSDAGNPPRSGCAEVTPSNAAPSSGDDIDVSTRHFDAFLWIGNFEDFRPDSKLPVGWKGVGTDLHRRDRVRCDKPEKGRFFARSGECAFQFRSNPDGSRSRITTRIVELPAIPNGAQLTFSAWVKPRNAPTDQVFGKAIVIYDDGTRSSYTLKDVLITGYAYTEVSESVTLDLAERSIKEIRLRFNSGPIYPGGWDYFLDDVTLTIEYENALLPLPAAP